MKVVILCLYHVQPLSFVCVLSDDFNNACSQHLVPVGMVLDVCVPRPHLIQQPHPGAPITQVSDVRLIVLLLVSCVGSHKEVSEAASAVLLLAVIVGVCEVR